MDQPRLSQGAQVPAHGARLHADDLCQRGNFREADASGIIRVQGDGQVQRQRARMQMTHGLPDELVIDGGEPARGIVHGVSPRD
ncbi:MAG TPA: hypothetical protein VGM23_06720 [Armatimonadota bacterium]